MEGSKWRSSMLPKGRPCIVSSSQGPRQIKNINSGTFANLSNLSSNWLSAKNIISQECSNLKEYEVNCYNFFPPQTICKFIHVHVENNGNKKTFSCRLLTQISSSFTVYFKASMVYLFGEFLDQLEAGSSLMDVCLLIRIHLHFHFFLYRWKTDHPLMEQQIKGNNTVRYHNNL